ncbi:hypothetical protein JNUCC74_18350 [Cerasibacillus sp. JNUCC 74]|uniref:hypothetical protein n=1 Tax=unclassified Gracilibacillus TaxID=2625209 RepID=UPI003F898388
MKKKIFLAGLIAMILAVMTACGSEPSSDAANEQDTEETVEEQPNDYSTDPEKPIVSNGSNSNSEDTTVNKNSTQSIENDTNTSETNDSNIEADPSNNQIKEESIHLSSGSEAIQYLAKELEMENNEDIIFDDMGGSLEEDAQGSYYTITLYSKELKEAGGSGTLESYKVYQNGKYELQ